MRLYVAKNDNRECLHCKTFILYGEDYVWNFSYNAKRVFYFHIACYQHWFLRIFKEKVDKWREEKNPPTKRGRPPKYKDGKEVHRLKVLRRYHENKGHKDAVDDLDKKISES